MTKSTSLVKSSLDDKDDKDKYKSAASAYAGGYIVSVNMKPTKAFKALGIEFWGSSKYNLDMADLGARDLIVNCSGMLYAVKPFVASFPTWMSLDTVTEEIPDQLLLEWRDGGAPPETIKLDFWESIINQATEHGITRIICCCMAGQGRTGTALAAFLLATGVTEDPELAINFIRGKYSDKAIESRSQENYLFDLIYPEAGQVFGKEPTIESVKAAYEITEEEWEEWLSGSSWDKK